MFVFVASGLALSIAGAIVTGIYHEGVHWATILGIVVFAAAVAPVVMRWINDPRSLRDYYQGGIVTLLDGPGRLTWSDWAIVFSRQGALDKESGQLSVALSCFYGLIPVASIKRPIAEFYRVEVAHREVTRMRRHRGLGSGMGHYHEVPVRDDYEVFLVDRQANRVKLLDLSTKLGDRRGENFVGVMAQRLERAVGGEQS
ncbi:hypothetical protein ACFL59_02985 [Planctomycetota bacterium]